MRERPPRPIRRTIIKRVNPYRIPEEGALTPRLRHVANADAIGFLHSYSEQDDEAESPGRD